MPENIKENMDLIEKEGEIPYLFLSEIEGKTVASSSTDEDSEMNELASELEEMLGSLRELLKNEVRFEETPELLQWAGLVAQKEMVVEDCARICGALGDMVFKLNVAFLKLDLNLDEIKTKGSDTTINEDLIKITNMINSIESIDYEEYTTSQQMFIYKLQIATSKIREYGESKLAEATKQMLDGLKASIEITENNRKRAIEELKEKMKSLSESQYSHSGGRGERTSDEDEEEEEEEEEEGVDEEDEYPEFQADNTYADELSFRNQVNKDDG